MSELVFRGKDLVFNHHLSVPYSTLVPHQEKGVGPVDLSGNLILQGDNLKALKALLPTHAGRVDCVFIDPPYNTGNEGWSYNDKVNAPLTREWLNTTVGKDDGLRHEKWLCMMLPRLRLLRELMSPRGSLWMTLDDHEMHRARSLLDEVFGEANFIGTCIWQKNYAPKSSAQHFSEDHDYLLVYALDAASWRPNLMERTAEQDAAYTNPDGDPRGAWRPNNLAARNYYSKGMYPITAPSGRVIAGPPAGSYWRVSEERFKALDADNRIWWGENGNNIPAPKIFLKEVKPGRVPQTLWFYEEVGHNQSAKQNLIDIMGLTPGDESFVTPKPVELVERVIALATQPDSFILDSFAGSGTTAHAVLAANARDGGERQFVLVEQEDYADTLTAERVRRVIEGYPHTGTEREELLRKRLTWTEIKKGEALLDEVHAISNLHKHRFTRISKQVKDGELLVWGETEIAGTMPGLGGGFTFCTLGEEMDIGRILSGETLPSWRNLGAWLFHTATGKALDGAGVDETSDCLGAGGGWQVWLRYQPDLAWLQGGLSALNLSEAQRIAAEAVPEGAQRLVFATISLVPARQLAAMGITFVPLPFALFRVEQA